MSASFPKQQPFFRSILLLRCPRCNAYPLRKHGSWFEFRAGCENCHYAYEREPGYFWGAAWMINYPLVGLFTMIVVGILLKTDMPLRGLGLATVVSAVAVFFGLFLYPYARAAWMCFDHIFHPLTKDDVWPPNPSDH